MTQSVEENLVSDEGLGMESRLHLTPTIVPGSAFLPYMALTINQVRWPPTRHMSEEEAQRGCSLPPPWFAVGSSKSVPAKNSSL